MDKLADLTKEAFKKDLVGLSPKVSELSEMAWFVFKMGGSVPINVISSRFIDFNSDLDNLTEMKVFRVIDGLVIFTEQFENQLLSKNINEINVLDVYNALVNNYSNELSAKYSLNDLIEPISTVLSVVIESTSPDQPVFLSKLLRYIKDRLKTPDLNKSKEILEYYLMKHMSLVRLEGTFGVNLSEKAVELVKTNPELWKIYNSKPKAEPTIEEKIEPEKPKFEPKIGRKKLILES